MFTFLFFLYLLSSTLDAHSSYLLVTQPDGDLIDRKIEIKIEKLMPFQKIELQAEAQDWEGKVWSSHAIFQADGYGIIDLSKSAPLDGSSYNSTDPIGLFWSMLPVNGDPTSSFRCKDDRFSVAIHLVAGDAFTEQIKITRYLKALDVQSIDVRSNGLVGTLFIPQSEKPLPVIITLSGSNGGLGESRAKLLASNGFAVLALGYFGVDGLVPHLQDIPLEYFEKAFAWLKTQSSVDGSHIGLYGVSRGAELSLILGSVFPDLVQAIVAVVPSSVIHGGLSETPVDAWLYQGKPIAPFAPVPQVDFTDGKGQTVQNPANTGESFLKGMEDQIAFTRAVIPVEKIRSPLLLISGGDDQMWPSEIYARQILDRLKLKGSKIQCQHLNYPDAGHGIGIPNLPVPEPTYYHPVGEVWFSMGGNREKDAQASRESWEKLIAFFHESLESEEYPPLKEAVFAK